MKTIFRAFVTAFLLALAPALGAQGAPANPFASLSFLKGTWEAKATRPDGVAVNGTYSFAPDLKGTILARHDLSQTSCHGPANFDCEHGDLLYVYRDAPGGRLKAIYFDNEGHVIHYIVSTPSPTSAEFLSDGSQPGPQFRLIYELKAAVMYGRFQMRMPGGSEWRSYLEWSGAKVAEGK